MMWIVCPACELRWSEEMFPDHHEFFPCPPLPTESLVEQFRRRPVTLPDQALDEHQAFELEELEGLTELKAKPASLFRVSGSGGVVDYGRVVANTLCAILGGFFSGVGRALSKVLGKAKLRSDPNKDGAPHSEGDTTSLGVQLESSGKG